MPSLSLSLYSVLCPLHGCSSSAPRQADPVPTPSRPHHSLPLGLRPLRSLRERDREIAVHFEQICTYWSQILAVYVPPERSCGFFMGILVMVVTVQ